MTLEIEVNGRIRSIAVTPIGAGASAGGRFRLVVDGVGHQVSATPTDLGLSLLFADAGRIVDAAVTPCRAGEWLVQLPHVSVTALIDSRSRPRAGAPAGAGEGAQRVLAPMPGRVVRVLVKNGDEVALRQGLIVVEAMKMENELGSPKAGRVKEIAVSEGASVEAGRLLVVVE
jgi:biotin carboxyl carrier protein